MSKSTSLFVSSAVLGILSVLTAAPSGAKVITFDGLRGDGPVPDGYGGVINWTDWLHYDTNEPPYNASSPPQRAYANQYGAFQFAEPVVFDGAFFNGYGSDHGHNPIHFELYLASTLVHVSDHVNLDGSGTGQFLDSGYDEPIDGVHVVGDYGYFVMDDVTFRRVGFTVVSQGDCPGDMRLCAQNAAAGNEVALVCGLRLGSTGPIEGCPGLYVKVDHARVAAHGTADENGNFCVQGTMPDGYCGQVLVQAVNRTTCAVSRVILI
ncbi:MAG: hypothetical protein HND57_10075 [Planctomycetes bacterium]|nr:hypothetical protein [Planctomycetota bacterium]